MVNYDEIKRVLNKEIDEITKSCANHRLSTIGDHDHIVGIIEGVRRSIGHVEAIRKKEEELDDDEDLN